MIQFENVSFSYRQGEEVLKDISFYFSDGERVALVGANGAGKSTLLRSCLGLLPIQGKVTIAGFPLNKENLPEIRKAVGYVFQNPDHQMFMTTVREDMLFGLMNAGMPMEEAEKKAKGILEQLDMSYLYEKYNHHMSGGEKRIAAIATILAMEPKIICMDEPTAGLDPKNRRQLIHILNALPMTRIITTHDLDLVLDTCQRVILMNEGKIVADGPARRILLDEELMLNNNLELPLGAQGRF